MLFKLIGIHILSFTYSIKRLRNIILKERKINEVLVWIDKISLIYISHWIITN